MAYTLLLLMIVKFKGREYTGDLDTDGRLRNT
jgi:hypothetical protein